MTGVLTWATKHFKKFPTELKFQTINRNETKFFVHRCLDELRRFLTCTIIHRVLHKHSYKIFKKGKNYWVDMQVTRNKDFLT
jgi:hypothetical protein